tara:strand:- start:1202 stop:1774 length:573 start_codon:yes stop_codon:yes gene_type:complete
MIRIALVGSIGSGKTYISKLFNYPIFNADQVVSKIYSSDKDIYFQLKKKIPNLLFKFPIKKEDLINAIIKNEKNIKIISSIVHPKVRKKLKIFLKKNKKKKFVILDIPLYLENKMDKKKDIIIFIKSDNKKKLKRIKNRKNFNQLIYQRFQNLQFSSILKMKKSNYVIKNDFNKNTARKRVKDVLNKILS